MKYAQANPSTAQTNAALVALKAARYVNLKGVYISSDTAMIVSLVNSVTHDVIWRQYVGANGGSLAGMTGSALLAQSALGEGIDYTTSENGNVFVRVAYAYSDD